MVWLLTSLSRTSNLKVNDGGGHTTILPPSHLTGNTALFRAYISLFARYFQWKSGPKRFVAATTKMAISFP